MPIISTDLVWRLSGGAGNTSPAASLGGAMSTVGGGVITTAVLNNVWDDVSSAEAAAGDIEYRGIYIQNNHGSLTLQSPVFWIDSLTTSAQTEADVALADEAVNVAMETIVNESTAPVGPAFTRPVTKGTGLAIANIPFAQFKGLWERRTVDVGAAVASDTFSVRVEGDTAP